jgi:hypothetical protein
VLRSVRIVSPDWEGGQVGVAHMNGGKLDVTLPELEAYGVAIFQYDQLLDVKLAARRIVPSP